MAIIDPFVETPPGCGGDGGDRKAAARMFAAFPQNGCVRRFLLCSLLVLWIAHPQLFLSASRDGSRIGFTSSPLTMLRKLFQPARITWVT
jgi:hypothetical protein